jgi:hypothetical protein
MLLSCGYMDQSNEHVHVILFCLKCFIGCLMHCSSLHFAGLPIAYLVYRQHFPSIFFGEWGEFII